MRALATVLTLSLVLGTPVAAAPSVPAPDYLAPALEQCLRANAPKVEAAVPDLISAVDFLVVDVCAMPVAAEAARQVQEMVDAQKAQYRAMCDKQAAEKASATAGKDETDEEEFDSSYWCEGEGPDLTGMSTLFVTGSLGQRQKPPAAAALAAQLLIDLRLSHSKAGSSH